MVIKKETKTKRANSSGSKKVAKKVVQKKTDARKTKNQVVTKKRVAKKTSPKEKKKEEGLKSSDNRKDTEEYFAKWTAPEHIISKEDNLLYYIAIVLSSFAIVWYFIQGSFLVVMTFAVLLFVILLQILISPSDVEYTINLDGIAFGKILYRYSGIDSFEVETREDVNVLKFKLKTSFLPVKEIYLGEQDPYYIRAVLENFLLEKKQEHTLFSFGKNETSEEYFSDEDLERFIEETEKKKGRG